MEKKQDLRIKKTKNAVHNAFFELLEEKGYRNITIKDISERAMINRKTFYFHYDTKEELYNEIMTEILDFVSPDPIFETLSHSEPRQQQKLIFAFLRNIKACRREFLILMDDDTNTDFNYNLKKRLQKSLIIEDAVLRRMQHDDAVFQLLTDVYFETFTRVLRWWLYSEQDDPASFIEMILMLFSNKPLEMLGLKEETLIEYSNLY